jgi:hypothetical protein
MFTYLCLLPITIYYHQVDRPTDVPVLLTEQGMLCFTHYMVKQ